MKDAVKIEEKGEFARLTSISGQFYRTLLLIITTLAVLACQKPERNNIWDEKSIRDPQEWAPQNLQIAALSPVTRKLSWAYGTHHIEGFKIDRKKGEDPWQQAYAILPNTAREWIDDQIVPDQDLIYQYKVYAYAGKGISAPTGKIDSATLVAPEQLAFTTHSITSVTLNWHYNITGHGGFAIDRKAGSDAWVTCFAVLDPEQTFYHDTMIDLAHQNFQYRVYSFYGGFQSQYVEIVVTPSIGMRAQGGIVFFLDGKGGGMVCAETNQSLGALWGCSGTKVGATGTTVGTGAANTFIIVSGCNQEWTAARLCNDLELNGYDDWFLPSMNELNLMYQNLSRVGLGGFSESFYWSSSEFESNYARSQHFDGGHQYATSKSDNYYCVRAARAFK